MADDIILRLEGLTKSYSGVTVLDDVSVDFKKGEVHCLVGENGAGKSTLIKMISGAEEPDSGFIEMGGAKYNVMTPAVSRDLGIEVIYQEFNLISSLNVAENVYLGKEIKKNGLVDYKALEDGTSEILSNLGIHIDPKAVVGNLTVAYMQLVEITKAVSKDAKVLIMDEPTAPLTTNEVDALLNLVKKLRDQGVTIIYISHRMNELFEIADSVTVLRDGKKIITAGINDITRQDILKHMVGRELTEDYPKRTNEIGKTVLEVKNIVGEGVNGISFDVREGEILGLGGLVGAGRTELLRILFGADLKWGGEIYLNGEQIKGDMTPERAVEMGIGLVPEDRKRHGLLLSQTISWNIALPSLKDWARMGLVNQSKEDEASEKEKDRLNIKTPSIQQFAKNLSGGNQQKIVLAKWLARDCKVLFLDEPTRGVDVGAKQEIYHIMNELAAQGIAIVMVSSEMEEIIGMADRIIVLREGDYMAELQKEDFKQETILGYAADIS